MEIQYFLGFTISIGAVTRFEDLELKKKKSFREDQICRRADSLEKDNAVLRAQVN